MKHTSALNHSPLAELVSQPEKLEAALRAARSENDAFAATRKYGRTRSATAHAASDTSSRSGREGAFFQDAQNEVREVEFQLEAPSAASVMLAASFTAWEKFALDMVKMRDGIWSIFVPLLPGMYAYRFIVDGRWCDDPRADLSIPGPFGTGNPAIKVV